MAVSHLKHCKKCGQELPREAYRPSLKMRDGLRGACRECERAGCKARFYANREEYARKHKEWREKNPEKHAKKNNNWYHANAALVSGRQAKYRENLGDELKRRKRREYAKNVKRYRANSTAWRIANPEKRRLSHLRREARKRSLPRDWTLAQMRAVMAYWKGRCPVCEQEAGAIHFDHWIPLVCPTCPGTVASNMVPLCARCNTRKNDSMPDVWLKFTFPTTWQEIKERVETYLKS